jgi:hypothetical protein
MIQQPVQFQFKVSVALLTSAPDMHFHLATTISTKTLSLCQFTPIPTRIVKNWSVDEHREASVEFDARKMENLKESIIKKFSK